MIIFLVFLLLLALFLQGQMAQYSLNYVRPAIRAEDYLAEPGEPFTLVYRVENHARIPVFFLRCRCCVPLGAELVSGKGSVKELVHTAEYRFTCFLGPRQSLEHRFSLKLPRRGAYSFDKLVLSAGDFFGIREEEEPFPGSCEVVVLPPRPEGLRTPEVTGGLLGERSVLRWIHEDPILSAGFREYTGREPLKTVSWSRSLQSGQLMVRQMDHTAEEKVTVLFSMDEGQWEELEPCLGLCRVICETLEKQKLPYAFLHNGKLLTSVGVLPPVEAGMGIQHLNRILEGLGRAELFSRESLDTLVRRTLNRSRDSSCYLLLVPKITPTVRRCASKLESTSGSTVRIISGEVL